MDLDIHLDGSNTLVSAAYLEVHIAEEVFQTLDIGQNDVIIIGVACYQTAGNTSYRSFDRYTCCHQGQSGCTDTCLGGRTIGFHRLRYGTDCIRELFRSRKYRHKRTLRQRTMTDLTASRSSGRFGFAYGVGREVVMVHISLGCLVLIQSVDLLCLGQRSQCTDI